MEERRADCKAHIGKTEELRRKVFGNGQPGIAYEVVDIKACMNLGNNAGIVFTDTLKI